MLDQEDDGDLERAVDHPVLFDKLQDLIQIRSDVLLHDGDEGAQLLEQEFFEGQVGQTDHVRETRHHLLTINKTNKTNKQKKGG